MNRIFVDTSAWYALVDKKDPEHSKAKIFFKENKIPLLTTNFVFDEIVTLIRFRLGLNCAKDFGLKLKNSSFVNIITIEGIDEDNAWKIFTKYQDKTFSYTDCTSFAILVRLSIKNVFCFDKHFNQYDSFNILPGEI